MAEDEECVDVGHAFLNLKDLLLTGNDVIEQQIQSRCRMKWNERMQSALLDLKSGLNTHPFSAPVVSLDEDKEAIGNLKVSLEAAKALTGIYQEFHQKSVDQEEEDISGDEEEEEDEEDEKLKNKETMQLIDYDDDSDL